jgi:hypothetical protein
MRVKSTMIVASIGQYGPFKDDGDKVIPYVELLDPDGGGVFRATASGDAEGTPPPVASLAAVELEFYVRDGGVKCRYWHIGPGAEYKQAKAA